MRTINLLIVLFVGILLSGTISAQDNQQSSSGIEINSEDTIEYDLIVFDSRFDTYLVTVPYSKDFYSNEYYRHWNIMYSTEWNIRHHDPFRYGDFYETYISYDQSIDYGIDFNFKLYQYFQFIENEHKIVLINRKGNW